MPEILSESKNRTEEAKEKYYSFQIKAWTNFDPMVEYFLRWSKS
jgi:hypothetical protein